MIVLMQVMQAIQVLERQSNRSISAFLSRKSGGTRKKTTLRTRLKLGGKKKDCNYPVTVEVSLLFRLAPAPNLSLKLVV